MICNLCPRECGAERTEYSGGGVCAMPTLPVVAKAMIHPWEEPCLTGKRTEENQPIANQAIENQGGADNGDITGGAGAVFFSGCALRCVFCQNRRISRENFGKILSVERLRAVFRELIDRGAACLDLVTPSHFTPAVLEALGEEQWPVPVVWNSGGYEKPETLRLLEGRVQVFLPDLKYALPDPARKYSGAADYFQWAAPAILEMFRQTGPYRIKDGMLQSGVLIRHLILPGELENTRRVIDWIAATFHPGDVLFSLMSQYTPPMTGAPGNLSRRVTAAEYRAAVAYMENCGVTEGYVQERHSARSAYTPVFDLDGI